MPYKNIEDRRACARRFSKTEKFKENQKKHKKTQKYKDRILKYKETGKIKEYQEKYRNSGKIREYHKNYINKQGLEFFENRKIYNRNYQKTNKYKEYLKKFYKDPKNLEKKRKTARLYRSERIKKDPNFKLRINISKRLDKAIKNNQKIGSAIKDLGCTIPELKIYLERQFKPGMSWDNWIHNGWHIDHKKALANFDLTDKKQFLEAVHYTNLQPLWWYENLTKSNKY